MNIEVCTALTLIPEECIGTSLIQKKQEVLNFSLVGYMTPPATNVCGPRGRGLLLNLSQCGKAATQTCRCANWSRLNGFVSTEMFQMILFLSYSSCPLL